MERALTFLDFPSANAFFKTCRQQYNTYKQDDCQRDPNARFLCEYPEECDVLFQNSYLSALAHYSNNPVMLKKLIFYRKDAADVISSFVNKALEQEEPNNYINSLAISVIKKMGKGQFVLELMKQDKRHIIKELIKNKIELNTLFTDKFFAISLPSDEVCYLYWAADKDDTEIIELLHEHGADFNIARKTTGDTLLHTLVADPTKVPIVQTLIDCGADVGLENNNEWSPIHYAASSEMENLLYENNAECECYCTLL